MDSLELNNLAIPCHIGILPHERTSLQVLDWTVKLGLDLEPAAGGDLAAGLDYAAVAEWLRFLSVQGRWRLLESVAAAAARLLLLPPGPGERRAEVASAILTLRKPHVLGGAAVPGIVLRREASWAPRKSLQLVPGVEGILLQGTPDTQAWRLEFDAGARFTLPRSTTALLLGGNLQGESGEDLLTGELVAHVPSTGLAISRPSLIG